MKYKTYEDIIEDKSCFSFTDAVRYSCNKEGLDALSGVISELKEQLEKSLETYEENDSILSHCDNELVRNIFALEHLEEFILDLSRNIRL